MGQCERVGVVVGADASQEWLLMGFYFYLRKYNPECPIAFADFGMSAEGRQWCAERGVVFEIPKLSTEGTENPGSLFLGDFWEQFGLDTSRGTPQRETYFKKPLAIAHSPFTRSLWLDLDCQVRGDLIPLMALPLSVDGLGATLSGSYCFMKNMSKKIVVPIPTYCSGVFLAEKNSAPLADWVSLVDGRVSFVTDEGPLSLMVDQKPVPVTLIPYEYHWPVTNWGENPYAHIYHWMGSEGKMRLKALFEGEDLISPWVSFPSIPKRS